MLENKLSFSSKDQKRDDEWTKKAICVGYWNGHNKGDLFPRLIIFILLLIDLFIVLNSFFTELKVGNVLIFSLLLVQFIIIIPRSSNLTVIDISKKQLTINSWKRISRFFPLIKNQKNNIIMIKDIEKCSIEKKGFLSPYWLFEIIYSTNLEKINIKFRSNLSKRVLSTIVSKNLCTTVNYKLKNNVLALKPYLPGIINYNQKFRTLEYRYNLFLFLILFYSIISLVLPIIVR